MEVTDHRVIKGELQWRHKLLLKYGPCHESSNGAGYMFLLVSCREILSMRKVVMSLTLLGLNELHKCLRLHSSCTVTTGDDGL